MRLQNFDQPGLRAVVLGGTGHLGTAIALKLETLGYKVVATGKRSGPRPAFSDTQVQIETGDDANPGQLDQWIGGADLVVDAATPYPLWLFGGRTKSDPVVDALERTDRVLAAVKREQASLLHISSFVTLPHRKSGIAQVQDGVMRGLHRYFDLKVLTEKRVLAALNAGLRGCVLAPSTVFGPFDGKPVEQAFIPMLMQGKVRGLVRHDLNVVDVRDVADMAGQLLLSGLPHQKIPVFGHNICVTELAHRICRLTGTTPPRASVPAVLGTAGMIWMETAFAALGRTPPAPSLPMMLVSASYAAHPDKKQQALLPELRPLDRTLADAIAWYRRLGRA